MPTGFDFLSTQLEFLGGSQNRTGGILGLDANNSLNFSLQEDEISIDGFLKEKTGPNDLAAQINQTKPGAMIFVLNNKTSNFAYATNKFYLQQFSMKCHNV